MTRQTKPRGAVKREDHVFIGVWIPEAWVPRIDSIVRKEDTDRSKFFRRALAKHADIQLN